MSAGLSTHYLTWSNQHEAGGIFITKSLEAWGIERAVMTQDEHGEDSLTLTYSSVAGAQRLWQRGGTLSLYGPDVVTLPSGTKVRLRLFYGWAAMGIVDWETGKVTHECPGAHYFLTRFPMREKARFYTDTGTQEDVETGEIILNRGDGTYPPISLEAQAAAVLAEHSADFPLAHDLHFPIRRMPRSRMRSPSIWEAWRALTAGISSMVTTWSYDALGDGGKPLLGTAYFEDESMRGVKWLRTRRSVWVNSDDGMATPMLKVTPRDDMLVPKVVVDFVTSVPLDGARHGFSVVRTQWPVVGEVFNGSIGENYVAIELRGPVVDQGQVSVPAELPPGEDIAKMYGQIYTRLWHEFEFEQVADVPNWALRIGELWSLHGTTLTEEWLPGYPPPPTPIGVCVKLQRDIGAGRTRVVCGPPGGMVNGTLGSLQQHERNRGYDAEFERADGDPSKPDKAPESCEATCNTPGGSGGVVPPGAPYA